MVQKRNKNLRRNVREKNYDEHIKATADPGLGVDTVAARDEAIEQLGQPSRIFTDVQRAGYTAPTELSSGATAVDLPLPFVAPLEPPPSNITLADPEGVFSQDDLMYILMWDVHSADPAAAYMEKGLNGLAAPGEDWSEASMAEWMAEIEGLMKVYDDADEGDIEQSEKEVRAGWESNERVALNALEKELGAKEMRKESVPGMAVADALGHFDIEGVREKAVSLNDTEPNLSGLDVVTMRWYYLQHLTQPII